VLSLNTIRVRIMVFLSGSDGIEINEGSMNQVAKAGGGMGTDKKSDRPDQGLRRKKMTGN